MEKYLEAGRIINTHGIHGEVKIEVWADSPEFLRKFKVLYIDEKPFKVSECRPHKGFLIVKFEGVDDVNTAMVLKNKSVFFDRSDAKLSKGNFFLGDIIGAKVLDESGAELGVLEDTLVMPTNNIYVVKGRREILIPAVPEFIIKTDVKGGTITVRLIDGM